MKLRNRTTFAAMTRRDAALDAALHLMPYTDTDTGNGIAFNAVYGYGYGMRHPAAGATRRLLPVACEPAPDHDFGPPGLTSISAII